MSNALITTGGGDFQQSGQLDWVSLSKSTFSFGLDVLVRLSRAELDPATIAVSLIIFNRFALNSESQKKIHDALSNLKSFSSYGKLVWFGFGVKSIIKDLADSEHGMACVALCACMTISYDSYFAAGVLRELCKIRGTPPGLFPSIHQWKTLVDICAGSVSHSKFPVLLQGMLRCVVPIAETALHRPTSKEALAIGALADVSTGELDNVTVAGGLDCIWLAAISEWLLSLEIEICHSSGLTVYKSPSNNGYQRPKVTIIFVSDNEQPVHLSKCYVVPKGIKFWNSSSSETDSFTGGRSEWNSILSDTFGSCFSTLIHEDVQQKFALFMTFNAQLTEACYQYGSKPNNTQQFVASRGNFLRRIHFAYQASKGRALLASATQNLPELAVIQNAIGDFDIESHVDTTLVDCIRHIRSKCTCRWCCDSTISRDGEDQPFCLLLVAETIFVLLWILSAVEVDSSVKPSSCGLRLLYRKFQARAQPKKDIHQEQERWKDTSSADPATYSIDILTAVLMIFSGSNNAGTTDDGESSAVSRNGICVYFKALEELNLLPEEASTVKVVSGHVEFDGIKYGRICDLVDDAGSFNVGPLPAYNLLVQETRQTGVIAAAYRISCNIESRNSLLGISELAKAITKSVRGPMQCGELCSRRSPHSAQEAIVFGPNVPSLVKNSSNLSLGPLPILRQWSLLSIPEGSDKGEIQLRIIQAVIYRLYSEIAHQGSYNLAFLDVCRGCSSTISSAPEGDKAATSLSPNLDTPTYWNSEGTIEVSFPSETGSWLDKVFQIFIIPQFVHNGGQGTATDAQNDITSLIVGKSRRKHEGKLVLHRAASLGYEGMLELLIQGGALVNATAEGETALHLAAEKGHNEAMRILLGRGALLEMKDRDGLTSLSRAARSGFMSTINAMMLYNPKLDSRDNNGQSALVWAAQRGYLAVVKRLLQEKADINAAAGKNGRTALQAAAEGGHLAVVERLLQEKADVNAAAPRANGRTALQAAAEGGHLAVVERLLQEKADVNAGAGYSGRTALQAAAERGRLAVVERLLQEKADVNAAAARDNGRTTLQAAAGGGYLAVVERLLQEKADVNAAAARDNGRTALQAAAEGGHLAVVERLLQEKSDVNATASQANGRTALQAAAEGGHLAVVDWLLQEKADVNAAATDDGITALQAASKGGHLVVVDRLLQEKADVNAAAGKNGRTALQAAAEGGHLAVIERLLQEKADINAAAGKNGRTALQAAAEGGHLAVVERLLQEKADVNAAAPRANGRTALQAAAEGGHLAVVERLLQEKADVNAAAGGWGNGRTALQAAAEGGHLAVVERLLQEKANVNATAEYSERTALQAAAERGHLTVVERLLQEKADINAAAAESDGRTALQAAAEGGHLAVVERLLQEKANVNAAATGYIGRTALQVAAEGGHLAVVERLLQEKADVNAAAAGSSGRTALQTAAEGGHLAVVERLLQEKADVNAAAARDNGRTALQAAAEGGHLRVVQRLLQEKADVNAAAGNNDRTALQAATERGHLAVIDCLRRAGAEQKCWSH
jgi:ankyrin repeat protein